MDSTKRQAGDAKSVKSLEDVFNLSESHDYHIGIQIKSLTHSEREIHSVSIEMEALRQLYLADIACENSEQAIVVVDKDCNIVKVNSMFTEITRYELEDIVGRNIELLEPEKKDIIFPYQYKELVEQNRIWEGEFCSRKKDGTLYKQRLTIRPCVNDNNELEYAVLTFTNLSMQLEQLEYFKRLAEFDNLTNLPNRASLKQDFLLALALAKRNNKRLGLLYIDLNDFKPVNDAFGHICGDEVLKVIANRMTSCIRETDTVSRVGGDEFLLNNIESNAKGVCTSMADKISRLIATPIQSGLNTIQVTASIGSAIFPEHGDSLDGLLKEADLSMYQYKRRKKEG